MPQVRVFYNKGETRNPQSQTQDRNPKRRKRKRKET